MPREGGEGSPSGAAQCCTVKKTSQTMSPPFVPKSTSLPEGFFDDPKMDAKVTLNSLIHGGDFVIDNTMYRIIVPSLWNGRTPCLFATLCTADI